MLRRMQSLTVILRSALVGGLSGQQFLTFTDVLKGLVTIKKTSLLIVVILNNDAHLSQFQDFLNGCIYNWENFLANLDPHVGLISRHLKTLM